MANDSDYEDSALPDRVIDALLEGEGRGRAFQLNPDMATSLSGGLLSPVYLNCRELTARPRHRVAVFRALNRLLPRLRREQRRLALGAVESGGGAWCAWLAHLAGLPMLSVAKEPKATGSAAGSRVQIDLDDIAGREVILVEDVVTSGRSVASAAAALWQLGIGVRGALAIADYELAPARENLRDVPLQALVSIPVLVTVARRRGLVSPEDAARFNDWYSDPHEWTEKYQQSGKPIRGR